MNIEKKLFWLILSCSIGLNAVSIALCFLGGLGAGHAPTWFFMPYTIINFPLSSIFEKTAWLPDGWGLLIVGGLTTIFHIILIKAILRLFFGNKN